MAPVPSRACLSHGLLVVVLLCHGCRVRADAISPMAPPPDWQALQAYDGTITRDRFLRMLNDVYAPSGAWEPFISVEEDRFRVRTSDDWLELRFAATDGHPNALRPTVDPARPLAGKVIALDPGHIGGSWSRMEERHFEADGVVIAEGELTLKVAVLLKARLEALGGSVHLVRSATEPVTSVRPAQLHDDAVRSIRARADSILESIQLSVRGPTPDQVQRESERLFYRTSEIRARADILRGIRPDLTVCIHFDAEPWGPPGKPELVETGHLHTIVNGAYSTDELAFQDVRADMLERLLAGTHATELGLNEAVADALADATRLPPYRYPDARAIPVGPGPYVWARNLLANRIYPGPVVFLEPYVMNSREFVQRVAAGDYDGLRNVAGAMRPSIFREYADAVARGLAAWHQR